MQHIRRVSNPSLSNRTLGEFGVGMLQSCSARRSGRTFNFTAQAAPFTIGIPLSLGFFAVTALLVTIARKRIGFFINGYRKGRTLRVAIALPSVSI